MNRKGPAEKLEAKNKGTKDNFDPFIEHKDISRHTQKLYTRRKYNETLWKRLISYKGGIKWMSPGRLTNKIFVYFLSKKTKGSCLTRWERIEWNR